MHSFARRIRPVSAYKREQAAISRRTLYPVTAFYSGSALILLILGLRTNHPFIGLAFFFAGVPVWTLTENVSHRLILHRRFKISKKWYKKHATTLAHKFWDHTHFGHHERPFDGLNINGKLKDFMPLFLFALPVSLIFFPWFTLPMTLAGFVLSYVLEEWAHHSMHYYNFRNRYFRHIKRYHLYHHTSRGYTAGYGITSAFWDIVFGTRFPEDVRERLFGADKRVHSHRQIEHSTSLSNSRSLQ